MGRAGKTIVIVVTVLSFLNSIGSDGSFGNENNERSILSGIARAATPIFAPIGVADDNWPATVGVITGIFAKEAVVGTLDALYTPSNPNDGDEYNPSQDLLDALLTIPDNLSGLADSLLDPLGMGLINADQTEEQGVNKSTFTAMETLFGGSLAAFSYLVFHTAVHALRRNPGSDGKRSRYALDAVRGRLEYRCRLQCSRRCLSAGKLGATPPQLQLMATRRRAVRFRLIDAYETPCPQTRCTPDPM